MPFQAPGSLSADQVYAVSAYVLHLNGIIGGIAGWFGQTLTLQDILGWIFRPIMFVLSVPWEEAKAAGALFGEKLIRKPPRPPRRDSCRREG